MLLMSSGKMVNVPLPPLKSWSTAFPILAKDARYRVLLHNPKTAQILADAFLGADKHISEPRVIIEAFPGPGVLSRAFLQQPESVVRKLILLEENESYLKYLRVCLNMASLFHL